MPIEPSVHSEDNGYGPNSVNYSILKLLVYK